MVFLPWCVKAGMQSKYVNFLQGFDLPNELSFKQTLAIPEFSKCLLNEGFVFFLGAKYFKKYIWSKCVQTTKKCKILHSFALYSGWWFGIVVQPPLSLLDSYHFPLLEVVSSMNHLLQSQNKKWVQRRYRNTKYHVIHHIYDEKDNSYSSKHLKV